MGLPHESASVHMLGAFRNLSSVKEFRLMSIRHTLGLLLLIALNGYFGGFLYPCYLLVSVWCRKTSSGSSVLRKLVAYFLTKCGNLRYTLWWC